jgi:hypothetical protein
MLESTLQTPCRPDTGYDSEGTLYLTLSLLLEKDQIVNLFGGENWSIETLGQISTGNYEDSIQLRDAIEPMFNDISDRKRHSFVDDFLFDTPSLSSTELPDFSDNEVNIAEIVSIRFPKTVSWQTEGLKSYARLTKEDGFYFCDVKCRKFWFAHSNASLTYHLSLEIHYQHQVSDYYALSCLQKLLAPKEKVSELFNTIEILPQISIEKTSQPLLFWEWLEKRFNSDACHFFKTVGVLEKYNAAQAELSVKNEAVPQHKMDFWNKLLLHHSEKFSPEVELPEHRTIFLLKDSLFFKLLQDDMLNAFQGDSIEPWAKEKYDCTDIVPLAVNLFENEDVSDGELQEQIAYYFISGFLQNIIDFFRQDSSEVQDSTDPIYKDKHFRVYGGPKFLYEVVAESRSLDCGEKWIGTCPYLFLTHIMVFHNEILIGKLERQAAEQFDRMSALGLQDTKLHALSQNNRKKIIDVCHTFRLYSSQVIHKYLYDNVMRYDTEKKFFDTLETVRQNNRRLAYWDNMFDKLEHSVKNIQDTILQEQQDRFNTVVLILSASGCFQIVMGVWGSSNKAPNALEYIVGILAVIGVLVTFWIICKTYWESRKLSK